MTLALLERPRTAVRPIEPRTAASPPRDYDATPVRPIAVAVAKAACVYALVAGLMTAIHWPVIVASDVPTRCGVALQIAMTASCVAGWFSLILIFDKFIGEQH